MKKQIRNAFKNIKYIAPDAAQKSAFRSVLQAHMNAYPVLEGLAKPSVLRAAFLYAHKPALAFLLIILLLMGTTGATFASQNALPGNALYPVKLATEKVRLTIAADPTEKTRLHLAFASRRLQELQEITGGETVKNSSIDTAFSNYKTQLEESQALLAQNPQVTDPIATLIDQATIENQQTIKTLSEKTRNKPFAVSFRSYLEDADEHAEAKNETANLALLDATSTQGIIATTTDSIIIKNRFKEKSHRKIESVKMKIHEMEESAGQTQGTVNPEAAQKIGQAKTDLLDAENQLEHGSFRDSFITSIRARQNAQDARRIIEHEKERDEKIGDRKNQNNQYKIKSIQNEEDD